WLRVILIYVISGVGGLLISGIFIPETVSVGASGSLFGLLGVQLVELLQGWKWVKNPCAQLTKLLIFDIILLVLGTLPYIDNYANIGGFLFGTVSAFVFVPYISVGKWDK
uniref:Peptidase S54 rhomboid domain-containing protein n=1 Tax=Amphimedon queenslandica TaxID=400682 RepID=A0A1X7UGE8_AMPQE